MLKRVALMGSISSNLHSFLKKIGKNLPLPFRKSWEFHEICGLRNFNLGRFRCSPLWIKP